MHTIFIRPLTPLGCADENWSQIGYTPEEFIPHNFAGGICQECGYTGEILIDENLEWYCPTCGNRDHNKLNVARRTCGYIGTNFWNKGRTQEIKERVIHVDNKDA